VSGAAALPARRGPLHATLSMIKFQHTLFALPFAFTGAILASPSWPTLRQASWILCAMVGARSAAMVWNRIADLEIDRKNPRTAMRPLVTGELSLPFAWAFLVVSLGLFFVAAACLNRMSFLLSPLAAFVYLSYSHAKRFTWLSHLHLGASLGLAPVGAWIGVAGRLDAAPLLLGAAVMLWVAGFDVLYACQDAEFDRAHGLHSVPARFGIRRSLAISSLLHAATVALFAAVALAAPLGTAWLLGVGATAALLVCEHRLVRPDDLSRLDAAFFTVNGAVSFVLLAAALAGRVLSS
jgi:4-hydroxybenzoate polyprenyltransferase